MSTSAKNIRAMLGDNSPIAPRRNLSFEAADTLRELILEEKLIPGAAVPERDLSEALGISRTPLKEALRILEVEGLIEYGPTRRPHVADPSTEDLKKSITVLGALEALAGELSCVHATPEEISAICALEALMCNGRHSPMEFFHLDMEFHQRIVASAQNEPLAETHRQYNRRLWRARFMSSRNADRRDNTLAEHSRIVDALSKRDAKAVSNALRTHLLSTIENIVRIRSEAGTSREEPQ